MAGVGAKEGRVVIKKPRKLVGGRLVSVSDLLPARAPERFDIRSVVLGAK